MHDDNKGVSMVYLNTDKASLFYSIFDINNKPIDYELSIEFNKSVENSASEPYCRRIFWKLFSVEGLNAVTIINKKLKKNIVFRLYNKMRTLFIN